MSYLIDTNVVVTHNTDDFSRLGAKTLAVTMKSGS
jgi:hypothetical protein